MLAYQEQNHHRGQSSRQLRTGPTTAASSTTSTTRPSPSPATVLSTNNHNFSLPAASTMPQYTSRDVGDPSQIKKNKQSMADLKLRRLTELNNRLREDLERERIPVSNAAKR
jgi:guanine nucleotide-binding protein subunit gamma, fungi